MQEEENGGRSIGDVFRTVAAGKWIALIIAAVVTVACVLALWLGYNGRAKNYVIQFSLVVPGEDNSTVYVFPDGTQFHYSDLTSRETLKAVKESDEAFKNINVISMVDRGDIQISREFTSLVEGITPTPGSDLGEIVYTITAKATYFSSSHQARNFLMSVADTPIDYLSSMEIDYDVYLSLAEQSVDYESEINYLKSQIDVIQSEYSAFRKTYGDNFVVRNGMTLLAYSEQVNAYKDRRVLDNLLTEARENKYLKSNEYSDMYELEKIELQVQLDKAQATLDLLKELASGPNAVYVDASVIKKQADLVFDLTHQIKVLDDYLAGSVNAEFDLKVRNAYNIVKAYTDNFAENTVSVYDKTSAVVYVEPNIISVGGGMGIVSILVTSLIVGVVTALIGGYIAGNIRLKKIKVKKNVAEEKG